VTESATWPEDPRHCAECGSKMEAFATQCPEGREGRLVHHVAFRCHKCEARRHDTASGARRSDTQPWRWVRSRATRSRIYLDRAGDCPDCGGPILPWTIVTALYFCDHCKTWWSKKEAEEPAVGPSAP